MKSQTDTAARTPQEVLNDLRALVIEAEEILGNDVSGAGPASAIAALRARFEAGQERLASLYQDAKRKVASGAKRADDTIHAYPYSSLAVAIAVGLIAGVVIGRSSKD